MRKPYEEMVRDHLPPDEKILGIINSHHAYGLLVDSLEQWWKAARVEGADSLTPLLNLSVSCQLIGEFLYGLERVDSKEADRYKKKYLTTKSLLDRLVNYISKEGQSAPAKQIGQPADIAVIINREFIDQLIKEKLRVYE
jgi:hypothetical protein